MQSVPPYWALILMLKLSNYFNSALGLEGPVEGARRATGTGPSNL